MTTERLICGLREKARQVVPEDGIVSAFATHFERDAARRLLAAADALERLQAAEKAWAVVKEREAMGHAFSCWSRGTAECSCGVAALAAALEARP